MIDPNHVTFFDRDDASLQEFWLFCIAVAGKKASMIAAKLESFLSGREPGQSPYEYIRRLVAEGRLRQAMMDVKLGKYGVLERAYSISVGPDGPDLRAAPISELQRVPGVKFKTARYFALHSRVDADCAVIDTHILKYLASLGHEVPSSIPVGAAYLALERLMLDAARAAGMSMADFDIAVWRHYSSKGEFPLPASPLKAV